MAQDNKKGGKMKPLKKNSDRIKYYEEHPELTYEELAPIFGLKNGESVRSWAKRVGVPNKRQNIQALRNQTPLSERVAKAIRKKKRSVTELADMFNVPPKQIHSAISILKNEHILVDNLDEEEYKLGREIQFTEKPFVIDINKHAEKEFAIGFVTDTHLGSKYERIDVLNALYDRFEQYGIKTVYHAGNWIDGEARWNKYDIYVRGVKDQVDNFLEKYPQRKGITTHIISGDDHEGWYVQREHVDIGQMMEDSAKRIGRNDLVNLGYMERDIEYRKGNGRSIIRVIHAGGGSTYATSYTSQKYVEALQGGEKPDIILVGHYHKFNYGYPREVHVIQGGCTQDQTSFMRKKKIQAMVGGVVVWIKQNNLGIFTSVRVEWLPFFDKKFFEYKW